MFICVVTSCRQTGRYHRFVVAYRFHLQCVSPKSSHLASSLHDPTTQKNTFVYYKCLKGKKLFYLRKVFDLPEMMRIRNLCYYSARNVESGNLWILKNYRIFFHGQVGETVCTLPLYYLRLNLRVQSTTALVSCLTIEFTS